MNLNFASFILVKVCEKKLIKREKKTPYVLREKDVMAILNRNYHPFFCRLYCTFQDDDRLCKKTKTKKFLLNIYYLFKCILRFRYVFGQKRRTFKFYG